MLSLVSDIEASKIALAKNVKIKLFILTLVHINRPYFLRSTM